MIIAIVLLLVVTFFATWWSRDLARTRGRHVGAWSLATAFLPPIVLILWALPPRASVVASS